MSDCRHEPIEEVIYISQRWGAFGPKPPEPDDGWFAALVFGQDPRGSKYAMMGCRHCKVMFVDIVPPIRKATDPSNPYRSEGDR